MDDLRLSDRIDALARIEPTTLPLLSVYLNTDVNETGRTTHDLFLRKELRQRARTYGERSPDRESLDRDCERIEQYLTGELQPSTRGVALFACSGAGLFEAIQLKVPFSENRLVVNDRPHLYPLARLDEEHPRYAALVVDTNSARIFVFGTGATINTVDVQNPKTKHSKAGGWSQARYQRRADNVHTNHMKEVVEALGRIVREEKIDQIVIAGDDVAVARLREQLPGELADKIIDVVKLQRNAQDASFLEATFDAIRVRDAETDAEKVEELLNEWQSGGLGVAGPEATLSAFELGQVDELVITGSVESLKPVQKLPDAAPAAMQADTSAPETGIDEDRLKLSAELIKLAQQTSARVRFIEDATLLEEVGGVGALLRFRV